MLAQQTETRRIRLIRSHHAVLLQSRLRWLHQNPQLVRPQGYLQVGQKLKAQRLRPCLSPQLRIFAKPQETLAPGQHLQRQ